MRVSILLLLGLAWLGCHSDEKPVFDGSLQSASGDGDSRGPSGDGDADDENDGDDDDDDDVKDPNEDFVVPRDSGVCGVSLGFNPPGCGCTEGESAACWTGAPNKRNTGKCKDGKQECIVNGEFPEWGPCQGEIHDCGEEPPPEPPGCPCVPGAIIGCDEDCKAGVFCAPSSTKVCQPDGTFGACREAFLPTADTNLGGCINLFHGCFGDNAEGTFVGDCSKAYKCGHAPNAM